MQPKSFKNDVPGFIPVDIKYLPQMPDETARRYLFVAIDRATRWVFLREAAATDFLRRLCDAAPMKIPTVLTDNGSQFTDRFTSKARTSSGAHAFSQCCTALAIEHRLCRPRHSQTNDMVERFNARIAEVVAQTRFASAAELASTLTEYVKVYNCRIPQCNLGHVTPLDALKAWRAKAPDLFKKRPKNIQGIDTYIVKDNIQNKRLNFVCGLKSANT